MDEIWGPVIGTLGFTALIVIPIIVNKLIKFKLEIARINAQTTIKAEEIRANNQLEIEKLINQENRSRFSTQEDFNENADRLKRRITNDY